MIARLGQALTLVLALLKGAIYLKILRNMRISGTMTAPLSPSPTTGGWWMRMHYRMTDGFYTSKS